MSQLQLEHHVQMHSGYALQVVMLWHRKTKNARRPESKVTGVPIPHRPLFSIWQHFPQSIPIIGHGTYSPLSFDIFKQIPQFFFHYALSNACANKLSNNPLTCLPAWDILPRSDSTCATAPANSSATSIEIITSLKFRAEISAVHIFQSSNIIRQMCF